MREENMEKHHTLWRLTNNDLNINKNMGYRRELSIIKKLANKNPDNKGKDAREDKVKVNLVKI